MLNDIRDVEQITLNVFKYDLIIKTQNEKWNRSDFYSINILSTERKFVKYHLPLRRPEMTSFLHDNKNETMNLTDPAGFQVGDAWT